MAGDVWASDVRISQPEPASAEQPVQINLGGLGFTSGGLQHMISSSEIEEIFTPTYAPDGSSG